MSTPGFGWYSASKYAIEALTDAVRGEVMNQGIDVVLIAPGLIRTEFVPRQLELLDTIAHPTVYHEILNGLRHLLSNEPQSPGPAIIAQAVLRAVTSSNPPVRRALPLDSKMAVAARWLFGARLFAWAVRQRMKLKF
jgi:short-subunit dehydrogenase